MECVIIVSHLENMIEAAKAGLMEMRKAKRIQDDPWIRNQIVYYTNAISALKWARGRARQQAGVSVDGRSIT